MKFKVLKSIRHNGVLYLPGADAGQERPDVGRVDLIGEIELTDEQAAAMTSGQIEKVTGDGGERAEKKAPKS